VLTHCFNLLVDITAVEDVMEIQEVELIKTDGCSFDIVVDFAECHDERDTVKSNKVLICVICKKSPLLPSANLS